LSESLIFEYYVLDKTDTGGSVVEGHSGLLMSENWDSEPITQGIDVFKFAVLSRIIRWFTTDRSCHPNPTTCYRVPLQRLTVAQLVLQTRTFYWNQSFSAVFTRIRHWFTSWHSSGQSIHSLYFNNSNFNIIRSSIVTRLREGRSRFVSWQG